eukprot:m51a1_g11267 hypothetical protein (728) ;mRNA; f:2868-6261
MGSTSCLALWVAVVALPGAARAEGVCGVRCWVRQWDVRLADTSQTVALPGVGGTAVVRLSSLHLYGLNLDSVGADRLSNASMRLLVGGLSTNLSFSSLVSFEDVPLVGGLTVDSDVTAKVSNASISIDASLAPGVHGLPAGSTIDRCSASVPITDLRFSGGIASFVLEAVKGAIAKAIEKALPSLICNVVHEANARHLSPSINNITQSLLQFLETPYEPGNASKPGGRSMNRNAVVDALQSLSTGCIGVEGLNWASRRLQDTAGWMRVVNVENIANAIDSSKPVVVPDGYHVQFPVKQLGSGLTIGVSELAFRGLDSWTLFDMFRPTKDGLGLDYWMQLRSLSVDTAFLFSMSSWREGSITTPEGSHLNIPGLLSVNASQLSLEVQQSIFVDTQWARDINDRQLADLDCLLSVMKNTTFPVVDFYVSLDQFSIGPSGVLPLAVDVLLHESLAWRESLLSLLSSTLSGTPRPCGFNAVVLLVFVVSVCAVVPVVLLFTLVAALLFPMRIRVHRVVHFAVQSLWGCNCLSIYTACCIVALLVLPPISGIANKALCGKLDHILKQQLSDYYSAQSHRCIAIDVRLTGGMWLLAVVSVVGSVFTFVLTLLYRRLLARYTTPETPAIALEPLKEAPPQRPRTPLRSAAHTVSMQILGGDEKPPTPRNLSSPMLLSRRTKTPLTELGKAKPSAPVQVPGSGSPLAIVRTPGKGTALVPQKKAADLAVLKATYL